MIRLVYILGLLLAISCTSESEKISSSLEGATEWPELNNRRIYLLIDSAIIHGDSMSYNKVASYYMLEDRGQEFFYYAFLMANKHSSREAAYHVFDIIVNSGSLDAKEVLQKMDKRTSNMALYYLLRSHEMGYNSARYQVKEIFGTLEAIPKSTSFLQEFARSEEGR
jgi:hypothetical protein